MYSMVASVVRNDGLLKRKENIVLGWLCAAIIVVMNMAFHYKDYGSSVSYIATGSHYHCWLDYQTGNRTLPPWFRCTMLQAYCTARCSLCCCSPSPPWLLSRLLELPLIESCFLNLKEQAQIRFFISLYFLLFKNLIFSGDLC